MTPPDRWSSAAYCGQSKTRTLILPGYDEKPKGMGHTIVVLLGASRRVLALRTSTRKQTGSVTGVVFGFQEKARESKPDSSQVSSMPEAVIKASSWLYSTLIVISAPIRSAQITVTVCPSK